MERYRLYRSVAKTTKTHINTHTHRQMGINIKCQLLYEIHKKTEWRPITSNWWWVSKNGNDDLHLFFSELVVFNLPRSQFASSNMNDVNTKKKKWGKKTSILRLLSETCAVFIIVGSCFWNLVCNIWPKLNSISTYPNGCWMFKFIFELCGIFNGIVPIMVNRSFYFSRFALMFVSSEALTLVIHRVLSMAAGKWERETDTLLPVFIWMAHHFILF